MNPIDRIGPYVYAALHSYNAAWQLALTRSENRTGRRDADALRALFPFLADYARDAAEYRARFERDYHEYTSTISSKPIALSIELALFLAVVCRHVRPGAILDLGSGFSSYVFRSYARDVETGARPDVHSIDTSAPWLEKTRQFLQQRQLDTRGLQTWDAYDAADKRYDVVLQDMADLDTRLHMLGGVLSACRPGGMLIIDDMHVPAYRRAVLAELTRRGARHFSLRAFTKKRLRYAYLVVT